MNELLRSKYDPTEYAHYKRNIVSFESLCFHATALYEMSMSNGGTLPRGAKTSYAKKILLYHPGHSLQTPRNMLAVAWRIQGRYASLLKIYRTAFNNAPEYKEPAEAALAKRLLEELESSGYEKNMPAIEAFLGLVGD